MGRGLIFLARSCFKLAATLEHSEGPTCLPVRRDFPLGRVNTPDGLHTLPPPDGKPSGVPLILSVGDGAEQRDFRAPRIQPRVLHRDRHISFEYRREIGVEGNGFGIL
jgi:hypothetical protein